MKYIYRISIASSLLFLTVGMLFGGRFEAIGKSLGRSDEMIAQSAKNVAKSAEKAVSKAERAKAIESKIPDEQIAAKAKIKEPGAVSGAVKDISKISDKNIIALGERLQKEINPAILAANTEIRQTKNALEAAKTEFNRRLNNIETQYKDLAAKLKNSSAADRPRIQQQMNDLNVNYQLTAMKGQVANVNEALNEIKARLSVIEKLEKSINDLKAAGNADAANLLAKQTATQRAQKPALDQVQGQALSQLKSLGGKAAEIAKKSPKGLIQFAKDNAKTLLILGGVIGGVMLLKSSGVLDEKSDEESSETSDKKSDANSGETSGGQSNTAGTATSGKSSGASASASASAS